VQLILIIRFIPYLARQKQKESFVKGGILKIV